MRSNSAIAVEYVVGNAPERDRVQPWRDWRKHRLGVRDADEVGEHAAVLDARKRLHAEVRKHRVLIAIRSVPGGAGTAGAATELERDHDALADLETSDTVAERHDFSD